MKKDPLRIQAHVLLGFLIIEYLLGMAASLFVEFPQTHNATMLWQFAKGQFSITAHIVIGLLMVIGAIVLLVRAIIRKDKKWIIAASVGLFGILVAAFAGERFVSTQQAIYSYSMAVAFIIAFVAYGWGIYKAKN